MAVRIRLRRTGRTNVANYRVVVTDQRNRRDGKIIETIGHYNPRSERLAFLVRTERIQYWLSKGAQPSATVARLIHKVMKAPTPAVA